MVSTADELAGDFSVGTATAGVFFFVILSLFSQLPEIDLLPNRNSALNAHFIAVFF
jgi:hypothetical protein